MLQMKINGYHFNKSMLDKNNSQEWGICKNNAVISVRGDINFSFRQIIYLKIKSVGKSFPEMFSICNFHFFFTFLTGL